MYVDILNTSEMDLNPDAEFLRKCKKYQRENGKCATRFENPEIQKKIHDIENFDCSSKENAIEVENSLEPPRKRVKTEIK